MDRRNSEALDEENKTWKTIETSGELVKVNGDNSRSHMCTCGRKMLVRLG